MTSVATFANGCFWCTEAIFKNLRGVSSVMPGYTGGSVRNPTYEQVSGGSTGHAEALQIEFDPTIISYEQLVEVFFATHNPTTLNRQGNDVGEQYRSAIFTSDAAQSEIAKRVLQAVTDAKIYDAPIVTTIQPLTEFYPAETYHQDYYAKNPEQPYCQAIISPKVKKFREKFSHLLKA